MGGGGGMLQRRGFLIENSSRTQYEIRMRAVPQEKGGTADNSLRNEIRPLFAFVKLAPPLHNIIVISN
jgi:hypothetical protein